MHSDTLYLWQDSHAFGQDLKRPRDLCALIVIAITGTMMMVEIVAGFQKIGVSEIWEKGC